MPLNVAVFFLACSLACAQNLAYQETPLAAKMSNGDLLGTVSSIAVDRHGIIYVLQRGEKLDPVIAIDHDGHVLRSWGKGLFSAAHSIRIDPEGNVWTVDAGNSMIYKFTPEGRKLQEIAVGEIATGDRCAFPGLCGTTDIAFGPNGRLFISDGYGNARILEYSSSGKRVNVWGSAGTGLGQFQIPHGIATDGKTLFVADRTNARVQRFDLDGRYLGEWNQLARPYALKFLNGSLWVAGMTMTQPASPQILKVDPSTGKLLGQTRAPGPHAIDVSEDEELFATGCCGGSNALSFSSLRRTR